MGMSAWGIRKLRAIQRHQGLTFAILCPLAVAAAWVSLRSPKEYVATTQVEFHPQDASARSLPLSPPSDEMYWELSQRLGLYRDRYRGYVLHELRSHSKVSFSGDSSAGVKRMTVTFQDSSADGAAAASTALARSVARSISDTWQKQQPPAAPSLQPQPAPRAQTDNVPTREEILLNDALHQDEELHAAFQQKASEWAHMRRQLSELSIEEREAMASQLNRQRAEQEKQIIALQKQIAANQKEEQRLRKVIANQPPEAHAPVPAALATSSPATSQQRAFPWTIAVSPEAEVKTVERSPWLMLLLPSVIVLALLIVLLVDRFDGTVKSESDLREQLAGSMRYLGAVPRMKHETLYR